jgi:hypothetical protein
MALSATTREQPLFLPHITLLPLLFLALHKLKGHHHACVSITGGFQTGALCLLASWGAR